MRRASWFKPGQSLPKRSGVGPRLNVMGAIAYWREKDADGKYELKCELLVDMLKMWDGKKEDPNKQQKKERTAEPEDYVSRAYRSSPAAARCLTPPVLPQHGNVDHIIFEKYCYEMNEFLNKKFPPSKFPPCLFIIDGAKSHKKMLLRSVTKSASNMSQMRAFLRQNIDKAPPESTWDEQAKNAAGKKLSKAELWAITERVKDEVPVVYRASQIFRWGRVSEYGSVLDGHEIIFPPPYHPELQ